MADNIVRFWLHDAPMVPGYTATHHDASIVKLENGKSLVYLKDMGNFFSSEHHPIVCWTGTGYLFQAIEERTIAGTQVISGTLTKGKETLYTAWWYSNGKTQTASAINWRWDAMLHGTPYSVVNATAASERSLSEEVARLITEKRLNSWIDRTGR